MPVLDEPKPKTIVQNNSIQFSTVAFEYRQISVLFLFFFSHPCHNFEIFTTYFNLSFSCVQSFLILFTVLTYKEINSGNVFRFGFILNKGCCTVGK